MGTPHCPSHCAILVEQGGSDKATSKACPFVWLYRGVEGPEGQTIYRSRSAMALLFGSQTDSRRPIEVSTTDWFGFEQAVSVLLEKKFNFTTVHRATRGKTDYGIDMLVRIGQNASCQF
jgi:hypothetical protein